MYLESLNVASVSMAGVGCRRQSPMLMYEVNVRNIRGLTPLFYRRGVYPPVGCMNLVATVNVVLYDRMAKAHRKSRPTE